MKKIDFFSNSNFSHGCVGVRGMRYVDQHRVADRHLFCEYTFIIILLSCKSYGGRKTFTLDIRHKGGTGRYGEGVEVNYVAVTVR